MGRNISANVNICIIRHGYFPDDPRDRKQAFALIEEGYSVDIICLRRKGQAAREKFKGANVFRIPVTHKRLGIARYFSEYALSLVMMSIIVSFLFVRKRYHCIQVSTMPDFLVFTTLIPRLFGAKVLLDLHEPTPELFVTKYGNRLHLLLLLQKKIEQLAIRYAHWSLTVTEALRRRFGERGANVDRITVVPNVCDEEAFGIAPIGRQRKSDGTFRLVTHGLIEERYGHELVIKALTSLQDNLPDIHYNIIGDGEDRKRLVEMVQQLKCRDKVHFLGFLPFDNFLQELLKADVGVIAMKRSPYSELIDTNKMYEYIHLRKPIIISRLPSIEENFDESCFMFFKPGDYKDLARCILELYQSPGKRRELVENAYSRYERMRWSVTKKTYLKVIEDLVGK